MTAAVCLLVGLLIGQVSGALAASIAGRRKIARAEVAAFCRGYNVGTLRSRRP